MRYVAGVGSKDARLAIVGEAPGAEEELAGVPFVGPSGKEINNALRDNGLRRDEVYITNVIKYRPPDNKFDRIEELGINIVEQTLALKTELESLKGLNCVLALGNTPLQALTGKFGIKKWRGSLLNSTLIPGLKVIPTIHPGSALKGEIESLAFVRADMHKAKREMQWNDFRSLTKREFVINPTFNQVIQALERFKHAEKLSVDIESVRGTDLITEIGLGDSRSFAITIPIFYNKPVWNIEEEKEILSRIRALLTNERIPKIIQNVNFERNMLYKWVGEIYPMFMDTMIGMHILYAEMPKNLGDICSLFTCEPHWKSDKEADTYNVKDVAVMHEAAEEMDKELTEDGLDKFVHGYQMPLSAILWRASLKGVKINVDKQTAYRNEAEKLLDSYEQALSSFLGIEVKIPGPKGKVTKLYNSPKEMQKLLYVDLKLPIQRKKGVITADEKAIEKLRKKSDHPALELIIKCREQSKLISTFLTDKILDADGRLRCEWVITGTATGRLSSRKNIRETGCNMQNQPKWIRDIYEADEGYTFIVADMSQVEARFVAWYADDPQYKKMFRSGLDIHKQVAGWIFKKDPIHVLKDERQKAKATAHGTPYGMGAGNVASLYGITKRDAEYLQNQYWVMFPKVRTHFQGEIEAQLKRNRTLTNCFGRRHTFFGWWGEELLRAAYADKPQGSAADTINMAITRAYFRFPEAADATPLLQVHDEWVIMVRDEYVNECARIFKDEVERPIFVNGDWMSIPLEVGIGKNWKDTTPWGE